MIDLTEIALGVKSSPTSGAAQAPQKKMQQAMLEKEPVWVRERCSRRVTSGRGNAGESGRGMRPVIARDPRCGSRLGAFSEEKMTRG